MQKHLGSASKHYTEHPYGLPQDLLVDSTDLWTLNIFPNGVIVLREGLFKQLVSQIDSVQTAAFMLVQAERQIHSTVQTSVLGVPRSKPRDGSDDLCSTTSTVRETATAEDQYATISWPI